MTRPSSDMRAARTADGDRAPSLALVSAMVAVPILVIDQSTKIMIRSLLPPCGPWNCDGLHAGPLAIINETNTGSAFSFRPGSSLWIVLAMASVLLVPVVGNKLRTAAPPRGSLSLALGLVAGG